MRVVHITSVHPRDDIRIWIKECSSLARHGYDVVLLVADGHGSDASGTIPVIDVGCLRGRFRRMLIAPWRLLKSARRLKGDIYHLHDPELLTIALALRSDGKKVIFDAHEDVPKQILAKHYLRPWLRKVISRLFSVYERYICGRIDGIIAATPTIRDKFAPYGRRFIDINNFPLLGELDPPDKTHEAECEVCYVGGIARIRGVKEMVQAVGASRHGKIKLNLVGTFAESGIEAELMALPGWRRVRAWGHQDRAGVKRALMSSKVGLVILHPTPNYLDSLPIKMFEYMAAGIPVVASNFPLWRQIIETNVCGICVDPFDVRGITDAIDELLSDPVRAERMGRNGRHAVADRYNWALEERKLLDFYSMVGSDSR